MNYANEHLPIINDCNNYIESNNLDSIDSINRTDIDYVKIFSINKNDKINKFSEVKLFCLDYKYWNLFENNDLNYNVLLDIFFKNLSIDSIDENFKIYDNSLSNINPNFFLNICHKHIDICQTMGG